MIAMSILSLWLPDEGFFVGPYIKRRFFARAKAPQGVTENVKPRFFLF